MSPFRENVIPCYQVVIDDVLGVPHDPRCTGVAEVEVRVEGWPWRAFCPSCLAALESMTAYTLEKRPLVRRARNAGPREIGRCGEPSCANQATWMVTLDFGEVVGEGGACDEHIDKARAMVNLVSAVPWVEPEDGDNSLQAKMRDELGQIARANPDLPADLVYGGFDAITRSDFVELDTILDSNHSWVKDRRANTALQN